MKKNFKFLWFKIPFYTIFGGFALYGIFLTVVHVAINLKLTDEKGNVDTNSRYFNGLGEGYNQGFKKDSSLLIETKQYEALHRALILNDFFPKNAQYILNALKHTENEAEVIRMLDAVDLQLKDSVEYMKAVNNYKLKSKKALSNNPFSCYEWMNIAEWSVFKEAVEKDKKLIDSVAKLTGVEERLIVACLVGEQIRLFNSDREAFKRWIGPLKILSVESKFSFGVTGIKDFTAQQIEGILKDSSSEYYIGKQYEHLLDFQTNDHTKERFDRLTNFRNHFYSYMYAALFLKQVKMQWERAGFPIDNRPEILATLFNVGFPQSKPKSNPRVGGSTILVHEKPYSFGALAFQFYYSGELFELFPFRNKKFDWDK